MIEAEYFIDQLNYFGKCEELWMPECPEKGKASRIRRFLIKKFTLSQQGAKLSKKDRNKIATSLLKYAHLIGRMWQPESMINKCREYGSLKAYEDALDRLFPEEVDA
jgi:hypothetical protein